MVHWAIERIHRYRLKKLRGTLAQWHKSRGRYAQMAENHFRLDDGDAAKGYAIGSLLREAETNVERIELQILTIETPRARVISN